MKVKFFTEGGENIGIGHITRCLSLCQAFEEINGQCQFVIRGNKELCKILENREIKFLDWINELDTFEKEISYSDIIVIDSYLADLKNYEIVCKSRKKTLFIDDFNRLPYPCGVILNGSIGVEEEFYSKRKGVCYLVSTKYIPLRKPFWEVGEKKINESIKSVLITFGGEDNQNMTLKVLEILENKYNELEKFVVIGSLSKNREKLRNLASQKIRLFENLDAEGMKNLMLKADIAISAGGQTTYELARVGTPSILIAVSENQLQNCLGWHQAKFAKYSGWWSDSKTMDNLLNYFKEMNDLKIREKMSLIGRKLVDGQGARRVVRKILGGD
ncbi:UDP-2,4-diacetamido-2,4,6-trideoxy-beta-L-altropyranose hydrolase [Thermodesulfovibrio sp.]|uniref:UDP-2,4-diacetamido-2,4, 6-trideoxy-beta-L-altropyranose hydrolase n=1 Tax=Thermodesulfovibrio sp. TaxID=2067987 RepID=UPI0030B44C92